MYCLTGLYKLLPLLQCIVSSFSIREVIKIGMRHDDELATVNLYLPTPMNFCGIHRFAATSFLSISHDPNKTRHRACIKQKN